MKTEEYLKTIDEVIARGPYSADWDSLSAYRVPEWYRSAKFGIFIHWGAYAVPAFGSEWYPRNMYVQGSDEYKHHIETYGEHKNFGYKDFIPMFKAEKFDPAEWAELFEEAGAKYVVPVAEHHDGFQMYKSDISHWNAYEMGPCRDTLGELKAEFSKRGIVTGASSHRIEHWFFMGHGKEFDSDIKEPLTPEDLYWPAMPERDHQDMFSKPEPTEEFMNDWLVRCCEIVDEYHPKIMYFDWWIHHSAAREYLKKFAAYYYNRAHEWGEEVVINYKQDAYMFGTAVVDIERGMFSDIKPYYWQTDTAVALNSWGYTENNNYRAASSIICDLVDIVSKNGCLLLNIGPKANGEIPKEDADILREIGAWLKVNGEAIYGTKVWRTHGEGPTEVIEGQFSDGIKKEFTSRDIRYTVNGENIYATALHGDENGEYHFTLLGEKDASRKANFHGIVKNVTMLGYDGEVEWSRDEEALHVKTGPENRDSESPVVFKVTLY
ncbi:MAG: alpha-L-fucosidase [Eubacteriales bacterium]